MKNSLARRFIITFILLILPFGFIAEGKVSGVKIDTRPITLAPEDNVKATPTVEKATPVEVKTPKVSTTLINTQNRTPSKVVTPKKRTVHTKPAVYKIRSSRPVATPSKVKETPKNPPLEVLDFDANYNVVGAKDTDNYLIVPIDKEQLAKEKKKAEFEDFTNTLIKDTPKPLTTGLKIKSTFHQNLGNKTHRVLSKIRHSRAFKYILGMLFVILFAGIGYLGYLIYQKRQIEEVLEEEKPISPEEKENDLIKAMQEFEQTEDSHEKLEPKQYIKEIETYKNLDGFKKDEVSDDILKTLKNIENAQKNEVPLTLKENSSNDGFKKHEYVFDEKIGELSDEEGMALFDEDEDEENSDFDNLALNYYGDESELFNSQNEIKNTNDIFIIEEDDEDEDKYNIVEEEQTTTSPIQTETQEEKAEEPSQPEEETQPVTPQFDVENLHLKENYPLGENKGIALINYHDTDALIGYIGSKITVLKRFEKGDNTDNLSVRIYEELGYDTVQYLVRIGAFKSIIEVTNTSIKLLLNL